MKSQPEIAPDLSVALSVDEEKLCRRYGRLRLLVSLSEFAVLMSVLGGLTVSGAAARLLAFSAAASGPAWAGHLVFLLIVGLIVRASLFPAQCLGEWWLDRRFRISHESFPSWLWEWTCRSVVFSAATVALLLPLAETLRLWPWLALPYALPLALPWCLAFLFCRTLFFDYVYYPLLACFYPVRFLRNETFPLRGVGKVTLPVYEIQVSHKTTRANACIRLRGKKTAIYVTDTLTRAFTDGEERIVMAHEFGHLYDHLHLEERTRAGVAQAQRKLMLGSAQLVAGCVSLCLMHVLAPGLRLTGVQDLSGFPLLAGLTLSLAYLFSPLLCAEARRDERDADEYALAVTGDVANYVSVMRKLRRMNLEESTGDPVTHLLLDTHPAYSERVHLAQQYRRRHHPRRLGRPPLWRGRRRAPHHCRR